MACAWLHEATGEVSDLPAQLAGRVSRSRWGAVAGLARSGVSSPMTSSVGRLFDAVAAMCGICPEVSYEGQAAVEFSALADRSDAQSYPMRVSAPGESPMALDPRDTILAVCRDLAAGVSPGNVSARFHNGLADATASGCARVAGERGLRLIVLSGGVFQNRLLLERVAARLAGSGHRLLIPERVPANDGGIAFGQAAVAAARSHQRR